MNENQELNTLIESFKTIADLDDEILTDETTKAVTENIEQQFSSTLINQSVNQIVKNLEDQGLTREDAAVAVQALKDALNEAIYGEEVYTGNKKVIIDAIVAKMYGIFDSALNKYHLFNIELPMTIEEGAQVPTYAHDTDAAADLYAMENTTVPAHSYGNKLRTGVKIQLPEGWLAFILPRSSIGAKTPLRLSNSVGLIDSGYRGELGVLYDNTSDEDYHISQGDRIAQLLIMPSYRFQAKVVDALEDSDRGEGGFGASGK